MEAEQGTGVEMYQQEGRYREGEVRFTQSPTRRGR